MNRRSVFSRFAAISFCASLCLSLSFFPETEPVGFHVLSDAGRVSLSESDAEPMADEFSEPDTVHLQVSSDGGAAMEVAAVRATSSIRRSTPAHPGSYPPQESAPGSPAVLRV